MKIGGFTRFSLIDYPGYTCAIIFVQGCNFRCPYCQNPELVLPEIFTDTIPMEKIFEFLKKRVSLIDAVEFTGGEPAINEDLMDVAEKIKNMGFRIKLDTNGSNPEIIKNVINNGIVDYIAMDVKASPNRYEEITRVKIDRDKIKRSIEIIISKAPDYEFRTTIIKGFHDSDEIESIGKAVQGADKFFIQRAQFYKTLEKGYMRDHFDDEDIEEFREILLKYVNICRIR
jgi:pyruvate formate lyase activating enzyme